MGLWLEHRQEGKLIEREPFFEGRAEMVDSSFTTEEARQMCRPLVDLPLEKREWALRVSFDDQAV